MKTFFRLASLLAFLVLVAVATAFGADVVAPAATQAAPQAVADMLMQSVFPVIGSLVLGLLGLALKKIGAKFHIESLTQQNNLLMQVAQQGVAFAEEKAATYVGSKAALTGNQKMDTAIAYICSAMPKLTEDEAHRAATAALAMIPGIGATGAIAYLPVPAASASEQKSA